MSSDEDGVPSIHERKQSLSQLLRDRPLKDHLYEMGVAADEEVLAASLQPNAFELQRRLSTRVDKDELIMKGIMPMDMVDEPELVAEDTSTFAIDEVSSAGGKRASEKPPESIKKKDGSKDSKKKKKKKKKKSQFYVGDRVMLTKDRPAVIRYIGKPHFSTDVVRYGLELDKPMVSGHDGSVGTHKYFHCKYGFGTFVKVDEIVELISRGDEAILEDIDYALGDLVQLTGDEELSGYVRYIGPTGIVKAVLVGLELTEPTDAGLTDGRFGGKKYFDCAPNTGYFARVTDVVKVIKTAKQIEAESRMPDTIEDDLELESGDMFDQKKLRVGQKVQLSYGREGVITELDDGTGQIGVELEGGHSTRLNRESVTAVLGLSEMMAAELAHGTASGLVSGGAHHMAGIAEDEGSDEDPFGSPSASGSGTAASSIKPTGLSDDSGKSAEELARIRRYSKYEEEEAAWRETGELVFDIGDYVTLKSGEKGLLRYLGEVDWVPDGTEFAGLEMDNWSTDCHDGEYKGKRYFRCKNGRGKFIKSRAIVDKLFIPTILRDKIKDPRDLFKRDAKTGKWLNVKDVLITMEVDEREKLFKRNLEENLARLSVGDRVELDRGRLGTVRFIGKVSFGGGESVGVELDKYFTQAHDGKGYFVAKMGHGIFVRRGDITNVLPPTDAAIASASNSMSDLNDMALHSKDRVRLVGGRTGVIEWIGKPDKKSPTIEMYGINLDLPDKVSGGSGEYIKGEKSLFECPPHRGCFVTRAQIVDNLGTTLFPVALESHKDFEGKLSVGQWILTRYYGPGQIKYMGRHPKDSSISELIGVELKEWTPNGNDGSISGRMLMTGCKPGHGYFCYRKHIEQIMERGEDEAIEFLRNNGKGWAAPSQALAKLPRINDRVRIFQDGRTGVVRFIAQVEFSSGVWIGLELDELDENTHNGTVKGKRYYEASVDRGYFTRRKYLIENLGSVIDTPLESMKIEVKVGDKVRLADGTTGVIQYIGAPPIGMDSMGDAASAADGDETEEMIGLLSDTWDPNGNDGTYKGQEFFKATKGRGLFTRRMSIAEVIDMSKLLQKHLELLPDLGDRVRLQSGEEAVVRFVEESRVSGSTKHRPKEKRSIGIELLDELLSPTTISRVVYLTDLVENLGKFIDLSALQRSEPLDIQIGSRVRLLRNKTGIVRYIGAMSEALKDMDDETSAGIMGASSSDLGVDSYDEIEGEMIGIELDRWSPSGHDGKGLFKCRPQRGYFVRREHVLEIIQEISGEELDELQTRRYRQMRKLKITMRKIEDLVKIANGKKKNSHGKTGPSALKKDDQTLIKNKDELARLLRDLTEAYTEKSPRVETDEVAKRELEILNQNGVLNGGSGGNNESVSEGDRVALDTGEVGRVVFIGEVHFDDRQMYGIFLDDWSPNAHNGSVDNVPYFTVSAGRGLLVPRQSIIEVIPPAIAAMEADLMEEAEMIDASAGRSRMVGRRGSVEMEVSIDTVGSDVDSDEERDQVSSLVEHKLSETELKDLPKVGDRITVGSKSGIVKWVGKTEFSGDEPIIGIDLDDWSANATDGSLMGKKYFDTDEGKGYFIRKQSYSSLQEMLSVSGPLGSGSSHRRGRSRSHSRGQSWLGRGSIGGPQLGRLLRRDSVAVSSSAKPITAVYFEVGDAVLVRSGHVGEVTFVGNVDFAPGDFVGLKLDYFDPNGHTGTVRGRQYFSVDAGRGYFVPVEHVVEKIDEFERRRQLARQYQELMRADDDTVSKRVSKASGIEKSILSAKVSEGYRVKLANGYQGIVRYAGKTDFGGTAKWYGLELDEWSYNGHDGSVGKKQYFRARMGRGYFTHLTQIVKVVSMSAAGDSVDGGDDVSSSKSDLTYGHKADLQPLTIMPEIGDRVRTVRNKTGIVRYVGIVDFAEGVLLGLQLDRWSPNGHDGTVDGRSYFEAPLGRGYFCRLSHLIENLGNPQVSMEEAYGSLLAGPAAPPPDIKPGDKVKLTMGKTGTVRFVGPTKFSEEEVVGIELDRWDAGAKTGTVNGVKYFDATMGRGYFTRKSAISQLIPSSIAPGKFARLKGLSKAAKYNGKSVKIIQYVEDKQRWRVKLLHSKGTEKKHLGVKEENLTPMFEWEAPASADSKDYSLTRMPQLDDRVVDKDGRRGTVRYIGETDFSSSKILVGLDMDEWSANFHNGSVGDRTYYWCEPGHGLFLPLHRLMKNLGTAEDSGSAPVPGLPKFNIGDKVKLRRGKIGVVRFVGKTDDSLGSEIVGIELDTWVRNGNDGTRKGKRLFSCLPGRGYFTHPQNVIGIVKQATSEQAKPAPSSKTRHRQEISKLKAKLRQLNVYKMKQDSGMILSAAKLRKLEKREYYEQKLQQLTDGTWDFEAEDKRRAQEQLEVKMKIMGRRASIDVSSILKGRSLLAECRIDDAVRLYDGSTGVVKFIGKVGFLSEDLYGLVMDKEHPNYHSGELDGNIFFECPPKRGYFAHVEEIVEVLGSTLTRLRIGEKKRGSQEIFDSEEIDPEKAERLRQLRIGQRVHLGNGMTGEVAHIGSEEDTGSDMVGIILDEKSVNAGDGTLNGQRYFATEAGRGYFARSKSIMHFDIGKNFVADTLGGDAGGGAGDEDMYDEKMEQISTKPVKFTVGDRIRLLKGSTGVVRYYGPVSFSEDMMVGIELDQWNPNGHDGSVEGESIFRCRDGRGYFARKDEICENMGSTKKLRRASVVLPAMKPSDRGTVSVGDRVQLSRGKTGQVKYIGPAHFADEDVIGIELDSWWVMGHDGSKDKTKYFEAAPGRGYFARRSSISHIILPKDLNEDDIMEIAIKKRKNRINRLKDHIKSIKKLQERQMGGDKTLKRSQLEKIDRLETYTEELYTLENAPTPTPSEAEMEAREVEQDDIEKLELEFSDEEYVSDDSDSSDVSDLDPIYGDGAAAEVERRRRIERKKSKRHGRTTSFYGTKRRGSIFNEPVDFEVNDRVKLIGGKIGIVRYLGPVDFTEEEMVGIELDNWDANAGSGTVKGTEYFSCAHGRGFFAKRNLIVENLGKVSGGDDLAEDEDDPDGHAGANEEESTGSVVRGDSATPVAEGSASAPAAPAAGGLHPSAPVAPQAPKPVVKFKIGDRVKLLRGKYGVIKFIGETHFAKGEIIGLELDTWHPCGHTGTVRGKKYFDAGPGRGYFTRRQAISEVVVPMVKPLPTKRVDATFHLNPFKIQDRVIIKANGQTGTLKYIGYPSFAEGEVFGLELDDWDVNAHDGTVDGIVIFETSPGRGLFVRRDEIDKIDEEAAKLAAAVEELKIGDAVELTNNRIGLVKYIGPTSTSRRTPMVGVHLDAWTPGAKNGVLKGVHYFSAPQGRGVFVRKKDIVKVFDPSTRKFDSGIGGSRRSSGRGSVDAATNNDEASDLALAEIHYNVGDRVVVEGGRKGTIRYIGRDIRQEEVYGIEMDEKMPKGTDGRHNHRRYFTCRPGRAIFVRKRTIKEKIDKDLMIRYDIGDTVKLSGGRLGMIKYVEQGEDAIEPDEESGEEVPRNGSEIYGIELFNWKEPNGRPQSTRLSGSSSLDGSHPRRRMSIQHGRQIFSKRSSGGSRGIAEQIDIPMSIEHLLEQETLSDSVDLQFTIGETVELMDGRLATVRFVGPIIEDGSEMGGSVKQRDQLGVELHDGRGRHDGVHRGVRYFTCARRKGMFVPLAKRRVLDDPSRQFLKRCCPQCNGKFLKMRNPRAAFSGVAMVCNRCCRHGNEFTEDDWWYQCSTCGQIDMCLECTLALPEIGPSAMTTREAAALVGTVGAAAAEQQRVESIRAKYHDIHGYYMFDDKFDDGDSDDSDNDDDESEGSAVSELGDASHAADNRDQLSDQGSVIADDELGRYDSDEDKNRDGERHFYSSEIKAVFDFFDHNHDGILEDEDIDEMYRASDRELGAAPFMAPLDYPSFQRAWQEISPVAAQNILHHIEAHSKQQIDAIFSFFDFDSDEILHHSDISRLLKMAPGLNRDVHSVMQHVPEIVKRHEFQRLWPSFQASANSFLLYLQSRLDVEIARRSHGESRKPSLLYKPVPNVPNDLDEFRTMAMQLPDTDDDSDFDDSSSSVSFDGPYLTDHQLRSLKELVSSVVNGPREPHLFTTAAADPTRGVEKDMLEMIRNAFEFYDEDADGTLTRDDVLRLLPVCGVDYMNTYGMDLFDPPCDMVKFYNRMEKAQLDGINIIPVITKHIRFRIEDVFFTFTSPPHRMMSEEELAFVMDSLGDIRRTEEDVFEAPVTLEAWYQHWSFLDACDQQVLRRASDARIISTLREIFNHYDVGNSGRLSQKDCLDIANVLGEDETYFVNQLLRPPCAFDKFVLALETLNRWILVDVIPKLKEHMEKSKIDRHTTYKVLDVKKTKRFSIVVEALEKDDEHHFVFKRGQSSRELGRIDLSQYDIPEPERYSESESSYETDYSESSEQRDEMGESTRGRRRVRGKRRESILLEAFLSGKRPRQADVVRHLQGYTPDLEVETAQAMRLLKRERDRIILDRKMKLRPKPQFLYERNLVPTGVFEGSYSVERQLETAVKRRSERERLQELFRRRPDMEAMENRGFIVDPFELRTPSASSKLSSISKLARKIQGRPSVHDLMHKGVLWGAPDTEAAEQRRVHRLHRRRMSKLLDQKLSERPMLDALIERGIIHDIDDRYSLEHDSCMARIAGLGLDPAQLKAIQEMMAVLHDSHSTAVQELDKKHISKMKEQTAKHSEDLADAQRGLRRVSKEKTERERLLAHSRSQVDLLEAEKKRLESEHRRELDTAKKEFDGRLELLRKQQEDVERSLAGISSASDSHMAFVKYYETHAQHLQRLQTAAEAVVPGIHATISSISKSAMQMKQLHSITLTAVQKEATVASSTRVSEVHSAFKEELVAKEREIDKLKADKIGMKTAIERKLQELKFSHEKAIAKERAVSASLSRMVEEQKTAQMKLVSATRERYQEMLEQKQDTIVSLREQVSRSSSKSSGIHTLTEQALEEQAADLRAQYDLEIRDRDVRIGRLREQLSAMQERQSRMLSEQRSLQKSKAALERHVSKLSDSLLSTLGGPSSARR